MLRTRLLSALVLLPLILGSVYVGGLAFFVVVVFGLLVAADELYAMARQAGYQPQRLIGLGIIAALLLDAYFQTNAGTLILTAMVVLTLILGVFHPEPGWLAGWGITLAGVLYVGWLGTYFILTRNLPDVGLFWTVMALVTAWVTDTGAYLAGTRLGRHGFFTQISPKKTWEGAIGGWIFAVVVMLLIGWLIDLPLIHALGLGLGIGIAATFGDLAESLFKRQTGVKDSGNIVPGHGGMLDRMDSLLFTAVFTYYYLVLVLRV